jgi:hypothetical protein
MFPKMLIYKYRYIVKNKIDRKSCQSVLLVCFIRVFPGFKNLQLIFVTHTSVNSLPSIYKVHLN